MIKDHAERVTPVWRVDELLRSPAADIASENVAGEQLSGVEGGTAAFRNPFRGFRTR